MPKLAPTIASLTQAIALRKRWLVALSALPFFGVVAAFGTAPDTVTTDIPQTTIVEELELVDIAPTDSGQFDFWREERVQRGDTLGALLARLGVSSEEVPLILSATRDVPAAGQLHAGRSVMARVTNSGRLLTYRYMVGEDSLVSIERAGEGFVAGQAPVRIEPQTVMRSGEIRSSLFGATDAAGVPDSIASQMAEVFSGDIDFYRDLRKGDRFSVVFESFMHDGVAVRTGRILAAEFINQGRAYRAVYFKDPQGREGYYTPDGKSMKRAFLKSPIPFSRVSSGFTNARYHPVLKEWRAHKGIDYAAPTGTPIRSVSDGVVAFAGRKGGYGNLLVINHQRPYSTAYGHLSRFAKGVRNGARVSQGDIVAYVGTTGLSTGPHLHFEFRVAGVQQNPMSLKLPSSYPLDARYRSDFAATANPLVSQLNLLAGRDVAALD